MKDRNIEIENRLTKLEEAVLDIKTNHLPHMEAKIDKLIWFIASSSFTFAVGLVYIILKLQ